MWGIIPTINQEEPDGSQMVIKNEYYTNLYRVGYSFIYDAGKRHVLYRSYINPTDEPITIYSQYYVAMISGTFYKTNSEYASNCVAVWDYTKLDKPKVVEPGQYVTFGISVRSKLC